MIILKGIAWDHPRGYQPLRAISEEFSKEYPEVSIIWDVRSLKEFGDMPIEELINRYDLITIDHPYMGQAEKNKLLLPLEVHISDENLKEFARQAVGPSFRSYHYNGHLYALPIDAAALVSVSRSDLLSKFNLSLPGSRMELKDFYRNIPNGFSVAWPLCATDLWCSFLSLCAQDGGRNFIEEYKIDVSVGSKVLDELKFHLNFLHPESINWNPIQVLDKMGDEEEIIYSPFLFGYSNYSRVGFSKSILSFTNSPLNPKNDVSTILGGVGLAISSNCKNIPFALKYLEYTANGNTQQGIYTQNGGQPGNLKAWESKENNKLCHDFFCNTLNTLTHAYVRPQHPGWIDFQEKGAELLHNGILHDIPSEKIMNDLNQFYQSVKNHE